MNSELIYLASPYSHEDPEMRFIRFKQACIVAGKLMNEGILVFSPIAHSHPIAETTKLPTNWGFWQSYCERMLRNCDKLYVLTLMGWGGSVGIKEEVALAIRFEIPVYYFTYKQLVVK